MRKNPIHTESMLTKDFIKNIGLGAYTDSDGYGFYSDGFRYDEKHIVLPSAVSLNPKSYHYPDWASHIVWFNK